MAEGDAVAAYDPQGCGRRDSWTTPAPRVTQGRENHCPHAAGLLAQPRGSRARAPFWGTRPELTETLDPARTGQIHVDTTVFSMDDAPEAYRQLHDGELRGRALVVP